MAAFRLAVAERCDGIELDIHVTADGAIVVHHDPVLANGAPIATLNLGKVRELPLPDGSLVPTLDEVMAATGPLDLFIEAKSLPPTADGALLALMASDPRPTRLHVHAFDHRIIARLAKRDVALSLGVLSSSYPVDPLRQLTDAGAKTLWQEAGLIDEALVALCRAAGVGVIAWTVNSVDEAARLAQLGVAGLCGNWPERLRNVKGAP